MLRPIIFRLGLRYTSRRLLQSLLFILGVALGVAVVVAVDLANNSASRAFSLSAESITGRATHQILGGPSLLPSELYTELRVEQGLRNSAPVLTDTLRAPELGDQTLRLLGVDPFAETPFRSYLQTINIIGDDSDGFNALTRFISQPGTVLLSQNLADRFGLVPGDALSLRTADRETQALIIGFLQANDDVSAQALDDLVLTDIATAQEITGQSGRISRIDLILPEGFDQQLILDLLPPGAALVSVSDSSSALSQMTAAFEVNLQALSLLAVVVGVFLIYNTVTFSVLQRRPVIGVLRSLGATKGQIFSFVIGEAFVLGLIGTIVGLGLGIIFGRLMVGLVSQTITDLYFTVSVTSLRVDPLTLLKGAGMGVLASLGAALVPSLDATRTAPAGSMRRSSLEEVALQRLPWVAVAAIVSFALGIVALQIPTTSLLVSFAALFFIVFGGALLTPPLMVLALRALLPLTSRAFGVLGRMAPRAIMRSLSRTSIAVAALTIAVSVIVGVSVMIASFRGTVANWLDNTLGADIYVSAPLLSGTQSTADIDPRVRELMMSVPGVERVSASRTVQAIAPEYPDLPPVNLLAVDFDIGTGRGFVWNNAPDGDSHAALNAGGVMVSEPFAFRRGITPDQNTILLVTDRGEVSFEVFGVYYDYATDQGNVFMARSVYDEYYDDRFISSAAAYLAPDADMDAVIQQLRTEALVGLELQVQSNRALRSGVFDVFERTFTITVALRLLATLVAFIGILSALLALQLEHTREYGVMRATGMTPGQLRSYTFIQTGLMGGIAGVLALPIGVLLAVVLVYVINVRSFGWTMQFTIPPEELLTAFVVAVAAALLAGIYPAYKLSTMNTSVALRSE